MSCAVQCSQLLHRILSPLSTLAPSLAPAAKAPPTSALTRLSTSSASRIGVHHRLLPSTSSDAPFTVPLRHARSESEAQVAQQR